jgi:hypothetical protein
MSMSMSSTYSLDDTISMSMSRNHQSTKECKVVLIAVITVEGEETIAGAAKFRLK